MNRAPHAMAAFLFAGFQQRSRIAAQFGFDRTRLIREHIAVEVRGHTLRFEGICRAGGTPMAYQFAAKRRHQSFSLIFIHRVAYSAAAAAL